MRLFVAVRPPPAVLDAIAAVPRPGVVGLRWTGPDQWHVTIRFFGRVEDPEPVVEALAAVRSPVCRAVLGPAVDRFGQRVLIVPVGGLGELATAVVAATADLGEPPEDRPFAGHVTLARVARGARVDLRPLCGTAVGGVWPVDSFVLYRSELHPHGARYHPIAVFPLEGA